MSLFSELFASPPGVHFIENKGQWPTSLSFHAKVAGGSFDVRLGRFSYTSLSIPPDEAHLVSSENFNEGNSHGPRMLRGHVLIADFIGFNPGSNPSPFGQQSQYYNYFVGADQSSWKSGARAYDGVIYSSFYQGVDLKVYSDGGNLKYDFILESGADPSLIQWRYSGAESLSISEGDLVVKTSLSEVIEKKPLAYQWIDGKKKFIQVEYCLSDNIVSFHLIDDYDRCNPLIIDPLLIFSTYSGSTADNWGSTATPGENGKLYSSGITNLLNVGGAFPSTPGAFQTSYGGIYDVAILKYDSIGRKLLYASYLGGRKSESPHSLVIDKEQNLWVLGTTSSDNFPTTAGAFSRSFRGGIPLDQLSLPEIPIPYENGSDIFVTKISKDGANLLASTYLGGSDNDGLNPSNSSLVKNYGDQMRGDIITDVQGNVFISSVTSSKDFPVRNSFNTTYKGGQTDALILKLPNDLSQISWAAFVGGNASDACHTIKIDGTGNIFVAGGTASVDFPFTTGVYQTSLAGDVDGWIAKISGDGSSLLKSTFTGTSLFNQVYFLDLDKNENVYVYGQTVGAFPITSNVYHNDNSGQFIQKFDNSLSTLKFSTVFGSGIGIPNISPTAFLVNDCNHLFLSGWGGAINSRLGYWLSSTDQMPVTPDALQKTTSGSDFYFMVLTGDASQLLYATFLGGNSSRTHVDGGTCRFDKNGIVYHAVCSGCQAFNAQNHATSDFPTTPNAWSRVNASGNCNNAAFKFDLSNLRARIQTNSIQLNHPGLNKICLGEKIVFQNKSIGGQTYYWDFGDGAKLVKTDTSGSEYLFGKVGTYTVKLKAIDAGTCAGADSTYTSVTVSKPQASAGPDQAICYNSSTTLIATGGSNYTWTSSDKIFTSSEAAPTVAPTTSTVYFVTITDINDCVIKDTINVRVVPGIDLKFKTETLFSCEGRPVLKATNLTDSSEDVFFDFGDGSTSDQPQAIHAYAADGAYNIRLIGKKEFCTYESSTVLPFYDRFIPNVFTPEQSPGLNDAFMIQYGAKPVPGLPPLTKISLKMYNRWGKLVFESNDYRNDWTASGVDSGTYYYEITISGECTCKGWVQIVK